MQPMQRLIVVLICLCRLHILIYGCGSEISRTNLFVKKTCFIATIMIAINLILLTLHSNIMKIIDNSKSI